MKLKSQTLHDLGQSIWYDNIERRLLDNGELASMIESGLIYGVTSNPSIFNTAIAKSSDYDAQLVPLAQQGSDSAQIYEALAVDDIRRAADLFAPLYERTSGLDGYVSLEVDPNLAHDTEATCDDAQRLWELVDRPNLMVKIPSTEEGLPAIRRSIAAGLNINITLIFSRSRYLQVMDAYLSGLEDRLAAGSPIDGIASVASFFVSRIDSKVDAHLDTNGSPEAATLKGRIAVANAKLAYQDFKEIFSADRFAPLRAEGARLQRPLWASTSTKNPAFSDVLYVDELIAPDSVNTVPPKTLTAFEDHGSAAITIENDLDQARADLQTLQDLGISLDQATEELEQEGVASFSRAFADLIASIESRREGA